MPKEKITLDCQLYKISILDENGRLDKDLEPKLNDEFLLRLYRAMVLTRRFDERMLTLQRQGRIGTFAPIKGQEAAQLGAIAALQDDDWLVPSFREMAAEVWHGKSLENILLIYGGYNEGGVIPDNVNSLPVSIPVATQTVHAVGIAYAIQYRKHGQVVMVFFGDGATSEGDFHEAMNFAAVFQAPVVFLCQNNNWAISVPREKQTRSKTLAQKAVAYGMPGVQVDGNDILAVYTAAKDAADRARSGQGPTLIECVTYRLSLHTTADDPTVYRKPEELEEWMKRDPIDRFQRYLTEKGLLTEERVASIAEEVTEEVKNAENRWKDRADTLRDPLVMFDHLFEVLPPYIQQQRKELEQELAHDTQDLKRAPIKAS